jgi:hypothetical protein
MSCEAAEEKAICGHSVRRTKKRPRLVLGENELKLPKRKGPFGARQQPPPPQAKSRETKTLAEKRQANPAAKQTRSGGNLPVAGKEPMV